MSQFVWLDYSERERRKMLDIVDLFREHDTRDELGIGSVRDTFADLFFPGTSTIMTRARYFLLVAWTYQRLEKQRIRSDQIAERARRAQTDLIEAIERSEDSDGNIGKVAKTALKRLPSSVYWQGMAIWGIRSFRGAQAQYYRSLDRYYALLTRHGGRVSERDVEHDDLVSSNWHAGLINPPSDFPAECSLRLTRGEAEYLAERIRLSPTTSGSLLAELVAQRRESGDVPFVWQHPFGGKERPEVQQNFTIKTGETAFLFLQHFIKSLKAGGRAGIVIKNTFLSNTDNASVALRKELLENCNLHTVLDMPGGTFQGAGVKTVVLFFEKGAPTRKIWFYKLNLDRNLGKTYPLNGDDLKDFVALQAKFRNSENSWMVDAKSIDKVTYDLSVKNPNKDDESALRDPKEIIAEMAALDTESAEILAGIGRML